MPDISKVFPSWGESGTLPSAGFFYQGGDQVNEKHFDALWNNVQQQFSETIDALKYDQVEKADSGVVEDGDAALVVSRTLADGETMYVTQAALTNEDLSAVATGMDLVIADSGGVEATVLSADGATTGSTADPIVSYTNSTGSDQTIGVYVDNGHFGGGSGGTGSVENISTSISARVR